MVSSSFDSNVRVAVVGATGVVGREILATLQERGHASNAVVALASERSVGQEVEFGEDTLEIEKLESDALRGCAVVFLAVPANVAKEWAPKAQELGAWVVDVSSAFRFEPSVPLVHSLVNASVLTRGGINGRIVACPSATGWGIAAVVEPLRAKFGVDRVTVTALVGASSAGNRGVAVMESQTANLLSGKELDPEVFPHRLAFNVIPAVGSYEEPTQSFDEESGWAREALRLFPTPHPTVFGTAIQVPTFYGHTLSMTVTLGQTPTLGEIAEVLKAAPSVKVLDVPAERIYPMPMLVTADPSVHVGRLRMVPGAANGLSLVASFDNAGRGAAQGAVEIAERLLTGKA